MDSRDLWVEKGGSRNLQEKTIIERIMLRFRPIAPKPEVSGSAAGGGSKEVVSKERKKRKYVRVKETRCKKDKKKGDVGSDSLFDFEVMQNRVSGFGGFNETGSSINLDFKVKEVFPGWMKMDNKYGENNGVESENIFDFELLQDKISGVRRFSGSGSSISLGFEGEETLEKKSGENNYGVFWGGGVVDEVDRRGKKVVESWMMVEGVSVMNDMWFGKEGWLGSTDMEKMKNLEMDVCPGLISDGFDKVQWVNLAYLKLVDQPKDDGESAAGVVVWLEVKEKLPVGCQAFACTVRVVYSWGNNRDDNNFNKKYVSQTMPCDVWRMDFGGFAWRLDSKAALSLGR